jgi:tape measure domain-containing protein
MATVDNKVVSLEFNNSRFTGNVQSTMSALDKLKEKLSFKDGTKGFDDIQRAANQVKVDNISHGIEGVSKGFIAMSAVAVTALSKIKSAAMGVGSRLASAVTIKPIKDGFDEFELGMKSTQTILANTADAGKTLDDVTAALTELNQYSDKTIYNFGQMASNIGKMTAAGVGLDTAVDAVKGLSNVAALFGADAQSAASATYQLSQAMSAGVVKAQDWISVSNANMGGRAFQESLFETGKMMKTLKGVDMGTTFDEWSKSSGGFKGSLEDGWLTTDVLNTTLKGFTGDYTAAQLSAMGYTDDQAMKLEKLGKRATESATDVLTFTQLLQVSAEAMGTGWSDTFKVVFGDFKESKKLFTSLYGAINKVVSKSAASRNLILTDWKNHGGRDTLIEGMVLMLDDLLSILKPVGQAFRDVFPKKNTKDLLIMTAKFKYFFQEFKIGAGTVKAIKGVFTVFFTAIKVGFKILLTLGGLLFKVVGAVGSFVGALAKAGGSAIMSFFKAIAEFFGVLTSGAGSAASGALDGLASGAARFGTWVGTLAQKLAGVTEMITGFTESLKGSDKATTKAEKSTSRFAGIVGFIKGVFSGIGSFFGGLLDGVASVGDFLSKIGSAIVGVLKSIVSGLGKAGGALGDVFDGFDWNTLIGGIGVGAGVVLVKRIKDFLDGVDIDKILNTIKDGIMDVLSSASDALKAFEMKTKSEAIMKIAIAVAVLTASLVVLASIKPEKLAAAGAAMAVLFVALDKTMKSLVSLQLPSGRKLMAITLSMLGISAAILILSLAMKSLQGLDNGDISAGLGSIGLLIAGLSVAAKQIAKEEGTLAKAGLAMIGMSVAVYILTFALQKLAKLDPAKAAAGAAAAATAVISMAYALKQIDEKEAKAKGLAFLSVGLAVNLFARAVEEFGNMPLDKMFTGFAAIAAIFGGLILFFKKLPPNIAQVATEILIISVAMLIMAKSIEAMGSIAPDKLVTGLIGIAAALGIMAIAAQVMSSAIVGAGAIVIMAVGLTLLAGAVATFGQMGVDTMIKSMLGIAAVLVIIATVGALMGLISPLLLAGGLAFVVLGTGMLLFGAGAWLAASAIVALAGASTAGIAVALAALVLFAKAIPIFVTSFAEGVIDGIKLVLKAIPGLMRDLQEAVTAILETLIVIVTEFIHNNIDRIVQAGFDLLLGFLRGIRDNIAEVTTTVAELVVNFINGLADAIDEQAEALGEAGRRLAWSIISGIVKALIPAEILTAIGDIVSGMLNWFRELLGIHSPSSVFMDLAGNIIDGLVNGLTTGASAVWTFFRELPGKMLRFLGNVGSTLLQAGRNLLQGLKNGLVEKFSQITSWLGKLPGRVVSGIGNITETLRRVGGNIVAGIKSGIYRAWGKFTQWVKDQINKIPAVVRKALGIESPSKVMAEIGGYFVEGMQVGMNNQWGALHSVTKKNTNSLISAVNDAAKSAKGIEFLDGMSPTIKPVLDLSIVEEKARTLGDILAAESLAADMSYNNAQQIVSTTAKQAEDLAASSVATSGDTNLTFVQNNNSPKALSTGDVYRQTKSQIAIARRELGLVS